MSTVNSRGQVIPELSAEDAEFIILTRKLRAFEYPRDLDIIKHLSYTLFKLWIHGLAPKQALFLTNEKKFSAIQRDVHEKTWLHDLYDRAWRLVNGFDF